LVQYLRYTLPSKECVYSESGCSAAQVANHSAGVR
jgi:hypothetical protein